MLASDDRIPAAVLVWTAPGEEPLTLGEALAGEDLVLLCFYPFDWSTTCTNEIFLLRDRLTDLVAAGIRPVGISRDCGLDEAQPQLNPGRYALGVING